jgi:GntR family transcriptional regulator
MSPTPLDRGNAMPLWAQLETDLRRRLERGEFDQGFPTDLQLTVAYEVSRHTVREAVRHLNRGGLLKRERGRGTVVNRLEFEQSLGTLYSLFESVEAAGVDQTSEVLRLEVVTDPGAAANLEVPKSTKLVLLERLRLAGGVPLAVDRAWLPHSLAKHLLKVDWARTALYAELATAGAPVPNQGWERLTPLLPASGDRKLLQLANTEAAFFLERLGCRDGRPVEWRTTVIRGDRYRFVTEWSAGSRSELRPTAT